MLGIQHVNGGGAWCINQLITALTGSWIFSIAIFWGYLTRQGPASFIVFDNLQPETDINLPSDSDTNGSCS